MSSFWNKIKHKSFQEKKCTRQLQLNWQSGSFKFTSQKLQLRMPNLDQHNRDQHYVDAQTFYLV